MGREIVMAAGRAAAGTGFIDSCSIARRGAPVTDPMTGVVTFPPTILYTGACRIQQAAAPWAGPATVGEAGVGLAALEIQLPVVGTGAVTKDDVVTVTACHYDSSLVGRKFAVQGAHHATHKTTRRLPLLEVVG